MNQAPMRLRVCKHCKAKFRPSRADAEFCGSLCRQAAYRMRKKNNEFENAEHRARRIADDAALVLQVFETYRRAATTLHMEAEERGIQDVKFMGTPRGILAVEKSPGALKLAVARCDWPGGQTLREMIETEGYSKSPEVLASGHMDEDGHVWMPPLPTAVGDLPPGYHFNVSDEDLDWERDDGGFAGEAADL